MGKPKPKRPKSEKNSLVENQEETRAEDKEREEQLPARKEKNLVNGNTVDRLAM